MPGLALSLSPAQPPGPLKQDRGRVGVYLFFILILIWFHTSICLPIYQVALWKSITGVRDERRATKMGRVTSMPGLALLSLAPAQPLGPTEQDRGRAGVCLFFRRSTN